MSVVYLLILGYVSIGIFLVGLVYRGKKIASMPVHLRWELSPVPHEKGKSHYGGSFLEDFEWWTKPRDKSLLNEAWYMFQEIVFLKGVWEKNKSLWIFSFPFHFGLYLLSAVAGLLILSAILMLTGTNANFLGGITKVLAAGGYLLGAIGTIGLLIKRVTDYNLRSYASIASYFNLVFLAAMFISGGYALINIKAFIPYMNQFIIAFLTFKSTIAIPTAISMHILLAELFILYLPFTYMMHFVAKYFTYHEVRWNDEPMEDGHKMEGEIKELLGQTVTWEGPHLKADGKRNWVDIATDVPVKGGKKE